jgi:tripartite-type tricarboxylate transporter receptor subunit TctC
MALRSSHTIGGFLSSLLPDRRRAAAALAGCAGAALVALAAMPSRAQAQAEYFKGKTIKFLVGAPAGGGYDDYGRLFAEFFRRHLPGQPQIVVQNMPGGGSLIVANHIYNQALPDGLTLATGGGSLATASLFGFTGARFDSRRFTWLGSMNSEVGLAVAWSQSPLQTTQDLFEKEFIVGGAGAAAASVVFPTAVNRILSTRFKIIPGYGGAPEIALAMERGEIHGMGNWHYSSIVVNRPDWIKDKKIKFLLQLGLERQAAVPDVPTVLDVAKTQEQKDLLRLVFTQETLGRPIIAPPGLPANIARMLQDGFDATMRDPDFKAEAARRVIEVEQPTNGADALKLVNMLYGYDADLVKKAGAAMATGK